MPKLIPVKLKKTKTPESGKKSFPVVAIGASSGGLEAGTELLKHLRPDTGMAFIFIQHLSPDYKSILPSLLAKSTKMKVQEIEDMELMKPNNVYVIPHNKGISVTDGHIQLTPRTQKGSAISIDILFTSLAQTHHEGAIGVILSGNASDGTMGLKAIKREGGITFAQDNSARYGSMPESAISEGVADFILSPKEIALELGRISKHAQQGRAMLKMGSESKIDDRDTDLKAILQLVLKGTGVDFSHYKMGTIKRRILRRLFLHKLSTLKQYASLLKTTPTETDLLYKDMLINVTDFFRDEATFKYLKSTVFPGLLKNKAPSEPLRVWVAGCSTGQESYSIAMLLIELLGNKLTDKHIHIFSSDLSEPAIKKARTGEYTKHEVSSVSPTRLERFFTRSNNTYRINKAVRDLCVFAPHNLLTDPQFSRIDFISCCNTLIYLDTAIHKKVFTTFHYSLNDGGCLMLGTAETTGSSALYTQQNKEYKIYTRKKGMRVLPDLLTRTSRRLKDGKREPGKESDTNVLLPNTAETISSILFSRYMPTYVVINHERDILQFKGETSHYLEHATGKATLNILGMARPEIAFELRESIQKAMDTKKEIHRPGIEIKIAGVLHSVSLDVIPLRSTGADPVLLVVFTKQEYTEKQQHGHKQGKGHSARENAVVIKLREALDFARARLIAVSEENERTNNILQTTSEEIITSNEELQSLNEEMETSKEEIESTNQELITTNQELQTRNEQLALAYNFSEAIVTSLHEPMLILDKNLRVRSSNKAFYNKFLVKQADIEGKLMYELGDGQWNVPKLREQLGRIIPKDTSFYDYEVAHDFPDIGKKTMLLSAMRIVQKVENEPLILVAITDTTLQTLERGAEKRELENIIAERTKALKEKNTSLEKANKELDTFTFISSHDLQEPLRKIKNIASCLVLEESTNLSDSGNGYLKRMQETVSQMQMLIEDLLTYSRINTTTDKVELTDAIANTNGVIADFKKAMKSRDMTIKAKGSGNIKIIRTQFRQLMYNLIGNSLKFSDPGKPLQITVRSKIVSGSKLKQEHLLPGTDYCHLTITDNGIGFDPQYKDRIFEVFQRLHGREVYKGSGIGLAICKRIVEKHCGIITATGELNKGARFDVYIPAA